MALVNVYKGKLTYTLAGIAILWAVVGYLFFNLEPSVALEILWAGLAAFGLRRAVK